MCSFPSKTFFFLLVMFSKTGTVYSRHLFLPVHCRISYSITDLFRQLHHLTEKMSSFQWPMSSVFPKCNRDCYHFHISAGDSTFSLSHACDEYFKHLPLNLVTWCKMWHLSYVPQTVFDIADPCSTRPDACLKRICYTSKYFEAQLIDMPPRTRILLFYHSFCPSLTAGVQHPCISWI